MQVGIIPIHPLPHEPHRLGLQIMPRPPTILISTAVELPHLIVLHNLHILPGIISEGIYLKKGKRRKTLAIKN